MAVLDLLLASCRIHSRPKPREAPAITYDAMVVFSAGLDILPLLAGVGWHNELMHPGFLHDGPDGGQTASSIYMSLNSGEATRDLSLIMPATSEFGLEIDWLRVKAPIIVI